MRLDGVAYLGIEDRFDPVIRRCRESLAALRTERSIVAKAGARMVVEGSSGHDGADGTAVSPNCCCDVRITTKASQDLEVIMGACPPFPLSFGCLRYPRLGSITSDEPLTRCIIVTVGSASACIPWKHPECYRISR